MTDVIWSATIHGEPASKANTRRLVSIGGKRRVIKSEKALDYGNRFRDQLVRYTSYPAEPYEGPVVIIIDIWYGSRRPDLDPSLILDLLQPGSHGSPGIIKNDRQVVALHCAKHLDPADPRAMITVRAVAEPPLFHGKQ